MEHIRLLSLILLTGFIFSGIVLLIVRFDRNGRFLKYIPSLVLFAGGAACIVKARRFSEGFEGLGYVILAIIALGGGVIALITAFIVGAVRRHKQRGQFRKTE